MKKWLKFGLIILFLIMLGGTLVRLGKWFGFATCGPDKQYDWKDEKCYQKCKNGCLDENCQIMGGGNCHNECVAMCEIPKYWNCMSRCKDLMVDGYDMQHYNEWFKENVKEYDGVEIGKMMNSSLPEQYKYNERIEDVFSGYIKEIEEYEVCISPCGEKPRIIR